jgi:hypothetical protein
LRVLVAFLGSYRRMPGHYLDCITTASFQIISIQTPSGLNTGKSREISRLKAYEVLRRIFGPKRDKIIGGWRKLQN